MKIGYVVKAFPRLSETFILTEIRHLEQLGCEVTVFSRYRSSEEVPHGALSGLRAEIVNLEPLLRERFWEPFSVHRGLAQRHGLDHEASLSAALDHRSREEMRYWLVAGIVAEQAIQRGLDLLHAHFATGSASVARYASRITRVPFSFTGHAKDLFASDVDPARLGTLLREATAVVTVSDANRTYLAGLEPQCRVERVYNGVDLKLFAPLAETPKVSPPRVLFVGRMVEKKGLADLIGALDILRRGGLDLRCRLVGTGPLEGALREQVRVMRLDDLVEFAGPASQEDIAAVHLPEASLFVLPCIVASDGDRDGLPTTLLEAMARGVPVITSDLPGVEEAVPHGEAGLLVSMGDTAALARAIRRALEDPEASSRRAKAARARVEHLFDARRNARLLLDVFTSAVGRRPAAKATSS